MTYATTVRTSNRHATVRPAAARSSSMMPIPPPTRRSRYPMGHGLTISKTRNRAKAAAHHGNCGGRTSVTARKPTISSQTIAEWSCSPSRRALSPQIQIPASARAATSAYRTVAGRGTSHQPAIAARSVAAVPGASGRQSDTEAQGEQMDRLPQQGECRDRAHSLSRPARCAAPRRGALGSPSPSPKCE